MPVIEYCLAVAVVAFVYADLLTDDSMFFGWLYSTMEKYSPEWLFLPIIGCSKCMSGQLMLWHYLYYNVHNYDPSQHILHISLTILLTATLKELFTWLKKKAYN